MAGEVSREEAKSMVGKDVFEKQGKVKGDDVANAECERLERLSEQSSTIGEQDE